MAAWAEVSVMVARERLDLLSTRMMDLGAVGLQEDLPPGTAPQYKQPWEKGPPPPPPPVVLLRGWWPGEGFAAGWGELERAIARAAGAAPRWVPVRDEDWAETWRAAFQRVEISAEVAVAPPWLAREGDLVIDPGMAFGTGEHPTTRACLRWTDRLAQAGGSCLDVGTGSGVVALLAARRGMAARGIDIDADAVAASRENAARNGVVADFDDTPLQRVPGRFDLVVANIFAEVLVRLAPDLARRTGRWLVLAGILADRADAVLAAMGAQGLVLQAREDEGEWVALVLQRPEGAG
ncbi:50S ribosomal protein L11 methyltransferase [Myxococcota bacterium]|nr:50S ribosomal protein L11 methyltransferase [Myxococcota bacterium]